MEEQAPDALAVSTPHILTDEMMDVLGRIARFVQEFDFSRFAPESINADLKVEDGHLAYGIGDDERAFIWVLRKNTAKLRRAHRCHFWKV